MYRMPPPALYNVGTSIEILGTTEVSNSRLLRGVVLQVKIQRTNIKNIVPAEENTSMDPRRYVWIHDDDLSKIDAWM